MEREEKDTKVKTGNAASSDPAILWLEEHGFGAVIWRFFFAPIGCLYVVDQLVRLLDLVIKEISGM